jgi:deoxyribonuclease-1
LRLIRARSQGIAVCLLMSALLWLQSCKVDDAADERPLPVEPVESVENLWLGAFNAQIFGRNKMTREGVPEILVKIIHRYDLILIQEIRDISETAVYELLTLVNDQAPGAFGLVLSDRLGRTASKEQYAYFYRPALLAVWDRYHFDDGEEPDDDLFEREPFVVRFGNYGGGLDLVTIGIHTAPKAAPAEIDHLFDVYLDAVERWFGRNIIIMGDFNADCRYLKADERARIRLWTDERFVWWIDDSADTTTGSTDCAYDRIVTDIVLADRVVPGSAGVFRFDLAWGISAELTARVSDHYPVEIALRVD